MGADFLPVIDVITKNEPFRFWCQKTLPLVYDDSLSYYELLCKVVNYLNKTMSDVNTLAGDVTAIAEAYEQLEEYVNTYFENLDVQDQINIKLDNMAIDGTLTSLVSPYIPDIVTAWLDEHITPTTPVIDATLSIADAAADAKATGDAVRKNVSLIAASNSLDILKDAGTFTSVTHNGITFSWNADNSVCSISGKNTVEAFTNIVVSQNALPAFLKTGQKCFVKIRTNSPNIYLTVLKYNELGQYVDLTNFRGDGTFTIPSGMGGIIIRLGVAANSELTDGYAADVAFLTAESNQSLKEELDETNAELLNTTENIIYYNSYDILNPIATYTNTTHNGITFTWNSEHTECSITGSNTSEAFDNMLVSTTALPTYFEAGKTYYVKFTGSTPNIYLSILAYDTNGNYLWLNNYRTDGVFVAPNDFGGIIVRIAVAPNSNLTNQKASRIAFLSGEPNSAIRADIAAVNTRVDDIEEPENLFDIDPDTLFGKYYQDGTHYATNAALGQTGYIPVTPGYYYSTNISGVFCLWYDSSKSYLGRTERPDTNGYLAITDAAYGRFIFSTADVSTFYVHTSAGNYTLKGSKLPKEETPYSFKNGVAFGTSLTYRAELGSTGGYLNYLEANADCYIENKGIGSAVILYDNVHSSILANIKSYTGYANKDFVLLEGFCNDWYYNAASLGDVYDTGETTVCGCVRSAINYILTQNANTTVVLVLDNYGQNYGGVDSSSTAVNPSGKTQYEFYEVIAKVAESLGVPVIKLYAISGISEKTPQYFIDNIHPSAKGARQVANTIWSVLKNIPLKVVD